MIDKLLLSWEEYNKKIIHLPIPYIFTIRNLEKYLVFFGAKHCYDKKDSQFHQLREEWTKFLKETKEKNCLVLVEGGRISLANSEDEGIREDGESGLITFLAHRKNIPVKSPEPSDEYVYQELTKQFSREYIYYFRTVQRICQWHRIPDESKKDLKTYLEQGFLKRDQKESRWLDFDFSLEHIKIIHKNLFNKDFDENDKEFFWEISRPDREIGILNKIARVQGLIRDIYIVEQIKKYWDEGKNLFIVFGQGHAVIQEPALRVLLK
ncbi:hypothetical protein HY061_00330 [Candidatus Azambacteria bacterium]|nr:hypothetical protein [Candidatus Azambacteria bacterium]